jgi:hypothetical protein
MSGWNVGLTKGDRDVLWCLVSGVDRVAAIAARLDARLRLPSLSELAALVRQRPSPL